MSHRKEERRRPSRLKKGLGMAILRFLIGELVLLALCLMVYLFVLQGAEEAATPLPDATSSPQATGVPSLAAPVPASTEAPTLASFTPRGTGKVPDVPDTLSESLMFHMRDMTLGDAMDLTIDGCAYIAGVDSADTVVYLFVQNAQTGVFEGYYRLMTGELDEPWIELDNSTSANIGWSFFTVRVDLSIYPAGDYRLGILATNLGNSEFNYVGDEPYHFTVLPEGGVKGYNE